MVIRNPARSVIRNPDLVSECATCHDRGVSAEQPERNPGVLGSAGAAFPIYPWSVLPTRLATALEPTVPGLAEFLVREISTAVPQYQGRRSERFWLGIRQGVEQSLHAFLQLIGETRGPDAQLRAVVRGLGRNEHEAGRTLDALQMAYRIGARHSWRTFAEVIAQQRLSTEEVTAFAESTFAFVDELAAESVAGYAESQAAAASEQERLRGLLLAALTGPSPDPAMVRRTASAVGWLLPRAGARDLDERRGAARARPALRGRHPRRRRRGRRARDPLARSGGPRPQVAARSGPLAHPGTGGPRARRLARRGRPLAARRA